MTKNSLTQLKAERPLDYVAVPIAWLEESAAIPSNKIGEMLRLVSHCYKNPSIGNRIPNAKGWKPVNWMVNCAGLQAKAVKKDEPLLWHWEGDDLILDCLLGGISAGLNRRNACRENALRKAERETKNSSDNEQRLSNSSAIAQQRLSNSSASIKYKDISNEDKSTSKVKVESVECKSLENIEESREEKEKVFQSQEISVEEGRAEFIAGSSEQESYSSKLVVESERRKGEFPDTTAKNRELLPNEEQMARALEVSKTDDFKRWAEQTKGVYTVDSLRLSKEGQERIFGLVREYEALTSPQTADDDIPF